MTSQPERFDGYPTAAVVIVPFKGLDENLAANVRSLCMQDFESFRLRFIVESEDDPAYPVLVEELARYPDIEGKVVVAGPAGPDEGQKVHNQLHVIDELLRERRETDLPDEAWVFADSDCAVSDQWLRHMVGPVNQRERTALTTGYRWLVPVESQGGSAWWSNVASVINSSVACFQGRDSRTFAWGGSMALLASTAEEFDLRGLLTGALCDDYQFTRLARKTGLRVYYVRECLVPSPVNFTFSSLYVFAYAAAIVWLIMATLRPELPGTWHWPLWFAGIMQVIDHCRATTRAKAVAAHFEEDIRSSLRGALRIDRWLTPLWMLIHWLLIVRTCFGRTMNWRGIRYRLFSPQRVKRLDV